MLNKDNFRQKLIEKQNKEDGKNPKERRFELKNSLKKNKKILEFLEKNQTYKVMDKEEIKLIMADLLMEEDIQMFAVFYAHLEEILDSEIQDILLEQSKIVDLLVQDKKYAHYVNWEFRDIYYDLRPQGNEFLEQIKEKLYEKLHELDKISTLKIIKRDKARQARGFLNGVKKAELFRYFSDIIDVKIFPSLL